MNGKAPYNIWTYFITIYFFGDKLSWFGNLSGDFIYKGENMRLYFPIASLLIVSIVLTLIFNIFSQIIK